MAFGGAVMEYKPDFEESAARIDRWWRHEETDRPVIAVTAPKDGKKTRDFSTYSLEDRWCQPELVCEMARCRIENTLYLGEAMPYQIVTLGPNILGAAYGNPVVFAEDTSWQEHSMEDLGRFAFRSLSLKNQWLKRLEKITELALETGRGKYFVSLPDLGGSAEILAHLTGTEALCIAMMDEPELVLECVDKIIKDWQMAYDHFYHRLQRGQRGSLMWLNAYSKGKTYPLQCDFSAMISGEQYSAFYEEEIRRQCAFLDDSIYHLDGKEALQHLDTLLQIEELNAIQWCPGASAKGLSMVDWIPLLQKIVSHGKSLHIQAKPEELPTLLQALPAKGLFLDVYCSNEYVARALQRKYL